MHGWVARVDFTTNAGGRAVEFAKRALMDAVQFRLKNTGAVERNQCSIARFKHKALMMNDLHFGLSVAASNGAGRLNKMKSKLITLLLVAGTTVFAQGGWHAREEQRDLRQDEIRMERLRADVARDRFELNRARAFGDRWRANQIARDLARDQGEFEALRRDMAHDRHELWEDRFGRGYR